MCYQKICKEREVKEDEMLRLYKENTDGSKEQLRRLATDDPDPFIRESAAELLDDLGAV
jgi:hypothetical protein